MNFSDEQRMKIPPSGEVEFNSNGTPRRVKGENLAAALISAPDFQAACKRREYNEITFLFLQYYSDFFKLAAPRDTLKIEKIQSDGLGLTHVRLQQVLNQIPVWGKNILIHFNQKDAIYLFQGDYLPSSALHSLRTKADVTEKQAIEAAVKAASNIDSQWSVQGSSKVIFAADGQTPRLAYSITLASGLMNRYMYFIDAVNGGVLHKTTLTRQSQNRSPATVSK